jgi:hypothetical protein
MNERRTGKNEMQPRMKERQTGINKRQTEQGLNERQTEMN